MSGSGPMTFPPAMNTSWLGILASGILSGSFVIPARKIRHLQWDQSWLVYCVVALLLLPVSLALLFAPGLFGRVLSENPRAVLIVAACGAAWGAGALLFAMSIPRLGFALANAIVSAVVVLVGSVSPLVVGTASLREGEGARLTIGLAALTAGISLCGWASILRDRGSVSGKDQPQSLRSSLAGIFVAVLSGVLSALINTAFAYGGELIELAMASGISAAPASLAVWVPAFAAGFLVNLVAVSWKLRRVNGWSNYQGAPLTDWLRAASLGIIWFCGMLAYGISSPGLGDTGTVYGWAVLGGVTILTSTAWGFAAGEWAQPGWSARLWMILGVVAFLAAFLILAV